MAAGVLPAFPCPECGMDLEQEGIAGLGVPVAASRDPEGKARLEVTVMCESCETEFYAFLAADQLVKGAP